MTCSFTLNNIYYRLLYNCDQSALIQQLCMLLQGHAHDRN